MAKSRQDAVNANCVKDSNVKDITEHDHINDE